MKYNVGDLLNTLNKDDADLKGVIIDPQGVARWYLYIDDNLNIHVSAKGQCERFSSDDEDHNHWFGFYGDLPVKIIATGVKDIHEAVVSLRNVLSDGVKPTEKKDDKPYMYTLNQQISKRDPSDMQLKQCIVDPGRASDFLLYFHPNGNIHVKSKVCKSESFFEKRNSNHNHWYSKENGGVILGVDVPPQNADYAANIVMGNDY